LNELETDPSNLSERWAILVNGRDISDWNVAETYQLLKRNGYDDSHIIFFHWNDNPEPLSGGGHVIPPALFPWLKQTIPERNWGIWYIVNYPNSEIDYETSEVTVENFLNAVKNLSSDDNDIVFIYYFGHGGTPFLSDGFVEAEEFNKALSSIKYGRLIYFSIFL